MDATDDEEGRRATQGHRGRLQVQGAMQQEPQDHQTKDAQR